MNTTLFESRLAKILIIICFGILLATMLPGTVFAGGMPQTELRYPVASGGYRYNGDYVSSVDGMNKFYSYYIEVPSGTSNLTLEVFDPNIRTLLDKNVGQTSTNVKYSLINPSGVPQTDVTCSGTTTTCKDNAWSALWTITNPAAGHWQFKLDMSSAVTTQGAINAFAVRATDASTTGAKELNMYAQSFDVPGYAGDTGTLPTAHIYPYVTSGCNFTSNEFDWDGNGNIVYTSRNGFVKPTITAPTPPTNTYSDDTWYSDSVNVAISDVDASDYGIWSANVTLGIPAGNGGNIITYYIGNYLAPMATTTPPTAQPQPNTFRMYMPTSAGATTAPVKPIVAQNLSLAPGEVNQPAVGRTAKLRVQVVVANPTNYPIIFSSPSNLVTAYIPGSVTNGTVYYAGSYRLDPASGTVSLPATGSGGTVTWNPGTVAANTVVTLAYDINVTPSALPLVVTGTPSSNGTQAIYVDETGNTSQALATYTFGPLCQLSVSGTTVPTLATLTSFDSYVSNGKVVVEWATSSEIRTLGFYLYRLDKSSGRYEPVTSSMLPSAFDNHKAATYRVADTGAKTGQKNTYMLVEVESKGKSRKYGPFAVTPRLNANAKPMATNFSRESIQTATAKGLTRWQKLAARKAVAGSKIKIEVREDGIYSLGAAKIANLLGVSVTEAANLIKNHNLSLSNMGEAVAYLPDVQNSRILFYGQGIKNNYTDENIYWLAKGNGLVMSQVTGSGAQPVPGQDTFVTLKHFEDNRYVNSAFVSDPESNYWFWDYIIGGDPDMGARTFNLPINGIAAADGATITIKLQGISSAQQGAVFSLNGTNIGQGSWQGAEGKIINLQAAGGLLKEGNNTLLITGIQDSIFLIDSIDVSYSSYYNAQSDSLAFTGGQNPAITVSGFSGNVVKLFDITDPKRPKTVAATIKNGSIGFKPTSATEKYLAVGSAAVKSVAGAWGQQDSIDLKSKGNRADYVILTSNELKATAQTLEAYRRTQGYSTLVVTVEDIMDQFNYGIYSPEAIKSFLKYAYQNWGTAPKYVVLAGNGSFDYKDYLGYGGQQVPPALVSSPDGLIASDSYYTDFNGDYMPEIAIGRLPASTAADLKVMINKIISYETGAEGAWTSRALLTADVPDEGGDFNNDVDTIAALFPAEFSVDKLYHADLSASDMNAGIMSEINKGVAFISFFGHGGFDRLSQDGILMNSDVASMTNGSKLPVITAMTCMVGNFAMPGENSLGEALLLRQNGGAIAIWAATDLSDDKPALDLDKAFFSEAFAGKTQVLGDIVLAAIKKAGLGKNDMHILDMYIILGDPALKVKGARKQVPSKQGISKANASY